RKKTRHDHHRQRRWYARGNSHRRRFASPHGKTRRRHSQHDRRAMSEPKSADGKTEHSRERSAHAHGKTPHYQRRGRRRRAPRPRRRPSARSLGSSTRLKSESARAWDSHKSAYLFFVRRESITVNLLPQRIATIILLRNVLQKMPQPAAKKLEQRRRATFPPSSPS